MVLLEDDLGKQGEVKRDLQEWKVSKELVTDRNGWSAFIKMRVAHAYKTS